MGKGVEVQCLWEKVPGRVEDVARVVGEAFEAVGDDIGYARRLRGWVTD